MVATKHTPGPWHIVYDDINHVRVLSEANYNVAFVYPQGGDPQAKANMTLIAAAPDLLAALESLLEDSFGEESDGITIARAAIAKASLPSRPQSRKGGQVT